MPSCLCHKIIVTRTGTHMDTCNYKNNSYTYSNTYAHLQLHKISVTRTATHMHTRNYMCRAASMMSAASQVRRVCSTIAKPNKA